MFFLPLNNLTPYFVASIVFEGMAEPFIFSISASEILANRFSGLSAILFAKAIADQSSLSSNNYLRGTADGANQNAVRTFFDTEIILQRYRNLAFFSFPTISAHVFKRLFNKCLYKVRVCLICMVNIKLKDNFVKTPRKFIIAKPSIHKLGSSSVLIIMNIVLALMNIRAYGSKALR